MPVNALTGLTTTAHADGTQLDAIGHDTSKNEKSFDLTMDRSSVLDVMMQSNQPLINGDFEAGNTGFSTDYSYDPGGIYTAGEYDVVTNPTLAHNDPQVASFGDHTSGSGLMMVVNGASSANQIVWSQSIEVFPNTDYEFSAWVASWTSLSLLNCCSVSMGILLGPLPLQPLPESGNSSPLSGIRLRTPRQS